MPLDRQLLEKYLTGVYHDPTSPASYSGVEKLWGHVKKDPNKPLGLKKPDVVQWLDNQETHQVYAVPSSKYKTEALIVEFQDEIDLFSRFVWVRLLKAEGRECKELRTDAGGEFKGREFQKVLEEKDIRHMIAYGSVKANYIERNRTFQDKLYRWMYANESSKYFGCHRRPGQILP